MRNQNLAKRVLSLRLLILDVDGVLTDGGIIYNSEGIEYKRFDVKDGLGLVMLRAMGINTAIITGRRSNIVDLRAKDIGIDIVMQSFPIKLPAYQKLKDEMKLSDECIGFIGDDLIDLDVMRHVGFAVAPADAHPAVRSSAHYICKANGGARAIRETIDLIMAFRYGEFGPIDYIPVELLERWQDVVWEHLSGNSPAKEGQ